MEPGGLTIIVGHYGSGKTEFAVSYALWLRSLGIQPVVADMDIVNPYFRARELKDFFTEKGIKVISGNYEDDYHIDMPALSAALKTCFESENQVSIADVGGDPHGARVLSRYAGAITKRGYDMWIAINANRPKTASADGAIWHIREIEKMSKLKVGGILNTTHMLRETSIEDIQRGNALVNEVAEKTGIEVIYTAVSENLAREAAAMNFSGEVFVIKPFLLPAWL